MRDWEMCVLEYLNRKHRKKSYRALEQLSFEIFSNNNLIYSDYFLQRFHYERQNINPIEREY